MCRVCICKSVSKNLYTRHLENKDPLLGIVPGIDAVFDFMHVVLPINLICTNWDIVTQI